MKHFSFNKSNIDNLIEISRSAGNIIMDIYEADYDINYKNDSSPLTIADTKSNEIIVSALNKLDPRLPIISEESSNIPFKKRSKWRDYWLIDPLDGTKEFIKKNGEFTTNISYISHNKPVFGMIHVPSKNQFFWGIDGDGAYFFDDTADSNIKNISVSTDSNRSIRIATSRSHPSPRLEGILEKIGDYDLISAGSSLKFCLVADGSADCYIRLGPTSEWDTGAGEIIARSAGAEVVDINGIPLSYNRNESNYLNPNFIVTNKSSIKKKILSLI